MNETSLCAQKLQRGSYRDGDGLAVLVVDDVAVAEAAVRGDHHVDRPDRRQQEAHPDHYHFLKRINPSVQNKTGEIQQPN